MNELVNNFEPVNNFVYSFGIIVKMAEENLFSEEVESIVKNMLTECLEYSDKDAEKMLKNLVNSIHNKGDEGLNIMIYQGKSSYQEYKEKMRMRYMIILLV